MSVQESVMLQELVRIARMLAEQVVALEARSPTWNPLPPHVVTQLEALEQRLAATQAAQAKSEPLEAADEPTVRTPPPRDRAAAWLAEQLSAGPVAASDIRHRAEQAGLSERQIRRAKRDLAIEGEPLGFGGAWHWRLPQTDAQRGVLPLTNPVPNDVERLGDDKRA